MTDKEKGNAWKAVLMLLFMGVIGFVMGLTMGWETSGEEEAFYKGIYSSCVAQTKDEVGCLNMQKLQQRKMHEWEWDLWQWPLPEVTPTPTSTPKRLEQNG